MVALALLKAPLAEAEEVPWYDLGLVAHDPQTGISIRFIKQFDITTDRNPTRFDCFMYESVEPESSLDSDIVVSR